MPKFVLALIVAGIAVLIVAFVIALAVGRSPGEFTIWHRAGFDCHCYVSERDEAKLSVPLSGTIEPEKYSARLIYFGIDAPLSSRHNPTHHGTGQNCQKCPRCGGLSDLGASSRRQGQGRVPEL